MAKNNHFSEYNSELDILLKDQAQASPGSCRLIENGFAEMLALMTNAIVVVSDISGGTSRIYCGAFASVLGLKDYRDENSIWEKRILSMMTVEEREAKVIAELRFFHNVRRRGKMRSRYYLMSKLRFTPQEGRAVEVLHRMYYVYYADGQTVRYAVCIYEPLSVEFKGRSVVVDSLTGDREELDAGADSKILSARERQILTLIDLGLKSKEIAERLCISPHTVSRHRQEIMAKLQVKNSIEACRIARSMELI